MSRYSQIAFTDSVRAVQAEQGSATAAGRLLGGEGPDPLGPDEAAFLAERDGVVLASVGEDGWPYVQHRGGPPGFLHMLAGTDADAVAFLDVRGNRQYLSAGNLRGDDRIAVLALDHAGRRRLKLLGRAEVLPLDADPALTARLAATATDGRAERIVRIRVEGVDWNCPQHITPRWSAAELEPALAPLRARLAELEAENARLRAA